MGELKQDDLQELIDEILNPYEAHDKKTLRSKLPQELLGFTRNSCRDRNIFLLNLPPRLGKTYALTDLIVKESLSGTLIVSDSDLNAREIETELKRKAKERDTDLTVHRVISSNFNYKVEGFELSSCIKEDGYKGQCKGCDKQGSCSYFHSLNPNDIEPDVLIVNTKMISNPNGKFYTEWDGQFLQFLASSKYIWFDESTWLEMFIRAKNDKSYDLVQENYVELFRENFKDDLVENTDINNESFFARNLTSVDVDVVENIKNRVATLVQIKNTLVKNDLDLKFSLNFRNELVGEKIKQYRFTSMLDLSNKKIFITDATTISSDLLKQFDGLETRLHETTLNDIYVKRHHDSRIFQIPIYIKKKILWSIENDVVRINFHEFETIMNRVFKLMKDNGTFDNGFETVALLPKKMKESEDHERLKKYLLKNNITIPEEEHDLYNGKTRGKKCWENFNVFDLSSLLPSLSKVGVPLPSDEVLFTHKVLIDGRKLKNFELAADLRTSAKNVISKHLDVRVFTRETVQGIRSNMFEGGYHHYVFSPFSLSEYRVIPDVIDVAFARELHEVLDEFSDHRLIASQKKMIDAIRSIVNKSEHDTSIVIPDSLIVPMGVKGITKNTTVPLVTIIEKLGQTVSKGEVVRIKMNSGRSKDAMQISGASASKLREYCQNLS